MHMHLMPSTFLYISTYAFVFYNFNDTILHFLHIFVYMIQGAFLPFSSSISLSKAKTHKMFYCIYYLFSHIMKNIHEKIDRKTPIINEKFFHF